MTIKQLLFLIKGSITILFFVDPTTPYTHVKCEGVILTLEQKAKWKDFMDLYLTENVETHLNTILANIAIFWPLT